MNCNECEKIKSIVNDTFDFKLKNNAFDFIDFLNKNSVSFERIYGYWKNQNYWIVKYKNECLCYILINGTGDEKQFAPLTIWTDDSNSDWYEKAALSDELKLIAWNNVDYCVNCGSCSGGKTKLIFGKEFKNVCRTAMIFTNPDKLEFDLIKKLICFRKSDVEKELILK